MPELLWSIVSERNLIEARRNTVSIIDVLEELKPPGTPAVLPIICFTSLWRRSTQGPDPEVFEWRLVYRWKDETGTDAERELITSTLSIERVRLRGSAEIIGFEIPKCTRLEFTNQIRLASTEPWKDVGAPYYVEVAFPQPSVVPATAELRTTSHAPTP